MKLYSLLVIAATLPAYTLLGIIPGKAVVIVPIADLVGQSQKIMGSKKVSHTYAKIPICGGTGINSCIRIHQLLFNEVVTILEEYEDEVKVKVPNLFFQTDKEATSIDIYWTLKKNILSFNELKKHHINLSFIPKPLDYEEKKIDDTQPIITLALPYTDSKTGLTFSAGTRFVARADQEQENSINVYALNPQTLEMNTMALPRALCIAHKALTHEQKISLFVDIVKQWAHQPNGFIPYVWGGCSFSTLCTIDHFTLEKTVARRGKSMSWYQRPDCPKKHNGFDCAGLVARATQLAGIPYFFKNTTTLAKYLKPLDHTTPLQAGDLIWLPNHVMIVADLEKNSIIEARHYHHGYGKVHEIALKDVFKDVVTFKTLQQKFFNQKPLLRLHKNGSVAQTIGTFKLLRLASVWD